MYKPRFFYSSSESLISAQFMVLADWRGGETSSEPLSSSAENGFSDFGAVTVFGLSWTLGLMRRSMRALRFTEVDEEAPGQREGR